MECKKCKGDLMVLTEDEGGMIVLWCYKCGSVQLTGEYVVYLEVGKKPEHFEIFDEKEYGLNEE